MTDQLTEIEQAEKVLRELEEKREALIARTKVLSKQRQECSYAAHTGDKAARAKLDKINAEASTHAGEIESVDAALQEATARLGAARQDAAGAADRDQAQQIAVLNAKLKDELDNADDAFSDAISSVLSARNLLSELHALGVTSPTDQLFRINAVAAIKTTIQELPNNWINDFEFMRLAPSQKKSFKNIGGGWYAQIANQIAGRLPADKKDAA